MRKLDLRLLRRLKNTKGQFIAIVLLVAMGIMVYIALSMAIINLESSVNYYYSEMNFADVFAQIIKIPETKVKFIDMVDGVKLSEGRVVQDIKLITADDKKISLRMISYNRDKEINKLYFEDGKDIENPRKEALIIKQFAEARGLNVGDSIDVNIVNKKYKLVIKGIVSSPEFVYIMENEQAMMPRPGEFGVLYVSEEFAQESLGLGDYYNELVFKVDGDSDITKDKIENTIKRYGLKRITTKENQLSNRMVSEEIAGVKQTSKYVPIIFLGAAAMTIALMISRIVKNDRTSIGIIKALGYGNLAIIRHYTIYSLFIGLIGAVIGVIMGTLVSGYFSEMYRMYFEIPYLKLVIYYKYIILGIALSIIFCIIAGILGARHILDIDPAESMRPEAPKNVKNIYLDRVKFIWNKMSFSWKMVIRNMLRSKKRFIFIVFGIAVTYANILFIFSMISSVYKLYDIQYESFQTMDYVVNFSKPVNSNITKEMNQVLNISGIEPRIEYPFTVEYLWKDKVVNIIGVDTDTQYYNFIDENGKSVKLLDKGIFLTEGMAKYLGVKRGDQVIVKSFLPDRKDIQIEVSGIIKQALGINGYINIKEMQNAMVDREMVTGVMLDGDSSIKKELEDMNNIFSIQSDNDMKDMFAEFLGLMILSTSIMVIMAGFIGFAIIYSTTTVSINERQLELASLRIMGFSKKEIFKLINKENIIMTIIGIIIGIPLGKQMAQLVVDSFSTEIYTLEVFLGIESYLISGIITIIFVVLAQLLTLKKINSIDFIEALKNRMT